MTRVSRAAALWLRASIACALVGALLVGVGCGDDEDDLGGDDVVADSIVGIEIVTEVGGSLLVDLGVGSVALTALPLSASGRPVTVANPAMTTFLNGVSWESSDATVASVVPVLPSLGQETAIAIATLHAPGEATITAAYLDVTSTVTLVIAAP